ncbi:hypothetical protein FB451DRAFT_1169327 [Mycena latifolia]|nr:hypothetical protein FB451DRAFT_1169327 [Mycena latifolia]
MNKAWKFCRKILTSKTRPVDLILHEIESSPKSNHFEPVATSSAEECASEDPAKTSKPNSTPHILTTCIPLPHSSSTTLTVTESPGDSVSSATGATSPAVKTTSPITGPSAAQDTDADPKSPAPSNSTPKVAFYELDQDLESGSDGFQIPTPMSSPSIMDHPSSTRNLGAPERRELEVELERAGFPCPIFPSEEGIPIDVTEAESGSYSNAHHVSISNYRPRRPEM